MGTKTLYCNKKITAHVITWLSVWKNRGGKRGKNWMEEISSCRIKGTHITNDVLFHFATITGSSLPVQARARKCAHILVLNTRRKKKRIERIN